MRAMERNREKNLHEASERFREKEKERLQEEARQEENNLNPEPRRQSACDRDPQPCIEVEPEQAVSTEGKVATLRKRFEVLQEQSNKKRNRPDFSAERLGREGVYAEIDETRMVEFEPPEQRPETITKTVMTEVENETECTKL